jgi:hypothetical protein
MNRLLRALSLFYMTVAVGCTVWLLLNPVAGWLTYPTVASAGLNDYGDQVVSVRAAYWEEKDVVVLCLRGRVEESRKESDYSLRVPVSLLTSDPASATDAGFELMGGVESLGWYIPRSYLGPPCSPALVDGVVPAERLEVQRTKAGLAHYYVDNKAVQALRVQSSDRAAVAEVTVSSGADSNEYLRLALVTSEPNAAGNYATGVETQKAVRQGNPVWRWLVPVALAADGMLWPVQVANYYGVVPPLGDGGSAIF